MHASTSEVLVLEFDSVNQAMRFDLQPPRQAINQLTGMLRSALLVSERVILTDSMVLDGTYFGFMSPSRVAMALGTHIEALPLTIICTKGDLRTSLQEKLNNDRFVWQSRRHFDETQLRAQREAWCDVAAMLEVKPYKPMPSPSPADRRWVETLSEGARAYLARIEAVQERSTFIDISRCGIAKGTSTEGRQIDQWWHSRYLISIAQALNVDWMSFEGPGFDESLLIETVSRPVFRISNYITDQVTSMSAVPYGVIRDLTQNARSALHRKPTHHRMLNLSYLIRTSLTYPSRPEIILGATLRLLIAIVAITAATPALPTDLNGWDLAWLTFATAALATMPWDAIQTLFSATRGERSALLAVAGSSQ